MKTPKISIISPSFNTRKFLKETVESIRAQSYDNWEHIIVDGASTDGTLELLKQYPHIKWISEKDSGYWEAFDKGLKMASGDYIMQCCISDGYLDKDWFKKCAEVMEKDMEVSLVWGLYQNITDAGKPLDVVYKEFHREDPPQKTEYLYYWLRTRRALPEGNYCLRADVWRECFPKFDREKFGQMDPLLELSYQFISRGYLPYFLRSVASFARFHEGHLGDTDRAKGILQTRHNTYLREWRACRNSVLSGKVVHRWRDGVGNILPYKFLRRKFLVEYVFSPRSIVRGILAGGASLTRKPLNLLVRSKHTPRWLVNSIQRLKFFYERKGW